MTPMDGVAGRGQQGESGAKEEQGRPAAAGLIQPGAGGLLDEVMAGGGGQEGEEDFEEQPGRGALIKEGVVDEGADRD